jgi:hypothetical protein
VLPVPCSGREGDLCDLWAVLLICVHLRDLRFLFLAGGGFVPSCLRAFVVFSGGRDICVICGPIAACAQGLRAYGRE